MSAAPQNRRKTIPPMTKLVVALRHLGYRVDEIEFDHDPALALRRWDAEAGDTDPPANHPDFIVIRTKADHKAKTCGRRGEKRSTSYGSDVHAIAKERRLTKGQEEFVRRVLEREPGEPRKRTGKIPSRPFPKGKRPFRRSRP